MTLELEKHLPDPKAPEHSQLTQALIGAIETSLISSSGKKNKRMSRADLLEAYWILNFVLSGAEIYLDEHPTLKKHIEFWSNHANRGFRPQRILHFFRFPVYGIINVSLSALAFAAKIADLASYRRGQLSNPASFLYYRVRSRLLRPTPMIADKVRMDAKRVRSEFESASSNNGGGCSGGVGKLPN